VSNAAFVLIAVAVIVVVSVLLWLVNRKPQTFMSSIDDFEREMKALGRETTSDRGSGHGRRRAITPSERRPSVDPSHVEAHGSSGAPAPSGSDGSPGPPAAEIEPADPSAEPQP
jgi:hypothetical protein